MKLDGVITEFADIYAPLAQIWKTEGLYFFNSEDTDVSKFKIAPRRRRGN